MTSIRLWPAAPASDSTVTCCKCIGSAMGNKKNSVNHYNNHRHALMKRRVPLRDVEQNTVLAETQQHKSLEGSRIVNMHKLQSYISDLNTHNARCEGSIIISGESRDGLASVLSSHCSKCNHNIDLRTSEKVKGPNGYCRWECNLAAVWGQMVTCGGQSHLQESLSVVGVPVMSKRSFIHTE